MHQIVKCFWVGYQKPFDFIKATGQDEVLVKFLKDGMQLLAFPFLEGCKSVNLFKKETGTHYFVLKRPDLKTTDVFCFCH